LTGIELSKLAGQSYGRGISQSKISKIENLKLTPSVSDVELISEVLHLPAGLSQELREIADQLSADIGAWSGIQRHGSDVHQVEIAQLEQQSQVLAVCQFSLIPGLLQTVAYAREIFNRLSTDRTRIDSSVLERVARQELLNDRSKRFEFLVAEWVFRFPILDQLEHNKQLLRIEAVSEQPNVTMAILPIGTDSGVICQNSFCTYDDHAAIIESLTHEIILTDAESITTYRETFAKLMASAAHGSHALEIVRAAKR